MRVITYGTFDLFHVGHVNLLERLSKLGTQLFVGLSTDEFNSKKGKRAVMDYASRKRVLESCKYVSSVFPETSWEQKEFDIEHFQIDIFAMGDDWAGRFDYLSNLCQVVYLPRTRDISTTDIKSIVRSIEKEKIRALQNKLSEIQKLIDDLNQ